MRGTLPAASFEVAAEINVTPMIDVMLVLLIIFMVVTPAMSIAALPRARHTEYQRDRHPTLLVDARGAFAIDFAGRTERVAPGRLRARLAEIYARTPEDHVIYLKADRDVGYGSVLTALDAARAAGVRRVAAITEMPRRDERR
ncbi:ExbD/TolR family protein [Longimicrobium sp.]|uniref:ExbD/TolR family protein n=1 Tax=Longimicrobium sp. TaxID=2029185 RepID=UPI002C41A83F|nr:biopolymer transporter ExbD [Longimicrobium sp.]HSU16897.1 biopolymer transporter ExbD [Longimicrobium sp.]